jgi:tetratricopeptide (TPR) repeat protein/predicted aspartyl protease
LSLGIERWLGALGLLALGGPVQAECHLGRLVEIPITMLDLQPTMGAQINGAEATFLVDSGAFYSILSPAKAAELKLRLSPAPYGIYVEGVGGAANAYVTTVKELGIFNMKVPQVQFVVSGSEMGNGVAGLLGQNFLRLADDDYDLSHGVIRLIRPHGCDKTPLAYWVAGTEQRYSVIDIERTTPAEPHTLGVAFLNGVRIRVMFDTGASTSFVSRRAAKRAGINLDSPQVKEAGYNSGVGAKQVKTWIAPVELFKVGDEEIHTTRLRIGEFDSPLADMLIGADFFLSHHVYVASSQHKLYFTYNGGPVFNLNQSPLVIASAPTTAQANPPTEPADATDPNEPTDAAGYSRRGTAFSARRDYEHAITDLTRACELDPAEASYFYERGSAYWRNAQPLLAAADFDQALKLRPTDISSLVARSEMRLAANDRAGAVSDLDVAQKAAANESDVRFELGGLYVRAGQYAKAITQFDLWIAAHHSDAKMADALSDRGFARTLCGQDLDKAVADSNSALRLRPHDLEMMSRRAYAELNAGKTGKAISDWDAVVASQPKNAFALYGRGVARTRAGKMSEGQADISAATALEPQVVEAARKRGLAP